MIPGIALPLLTWRELERRVCGTAIIDVDILEKTTEYQVSARSQDERNRDARKCWFSLLRACRCGWTLCALPRHAWVRILV